MEYSGGRLLLPIYEPKATDENLRQRPADLPEFERPPVTEVVLGVQLDPLPQLRSAHLGLLWGQLRDELPVLEEHPALDLPEENFESASGGVFTIQLAGTPPVPRQWFINKDG